MPKSGTRKGCKTQSGGGFKPADETSLEKGRRLNIIIAGVVAILAVAVAFYWWDLGETKREFLVLDLKGKGALSQVTNEKSLGGGTSGQVKRGPIQASSRPLDLIIGHRPSQATMKHISPHPFGSCFGTRPYCNLLRQA